MQIKEHGKPGISRFLIDLLMHTLLSHNNELSQGPKYVKNLLTYIKNLPTYLKNLPTYIRNLPTCAH